MWAELGDMVSLDAGHIYVDRLFYPTLALGPGKRIALWLAGCSRHCAGCANPELWERSEHQRIAVSALKRMLADVMAHDTVEGLTLTGGEPFEQAAAVCALLDGLAFDGDVLAYSGYTIAEIRANLRMRALLKRVDALVDGAYIDEINDGQAALRGSLNQTLHVLNADAAQKYAEYTAQGRRIQNVVYGGELLSIGIHSRTDGKGGS